MKGHYQPDKDNAGLPPIDSGSGIPDIATIEKMTGLKFLGIPIENMKLIDGQLHIIINTPGSTL